MDFVSEIWWRQFDYPIPLQTGKLKRIKFRCASISIYHRESYVFGSTIAPCDFQQKWDVIRHSDECGCIVLHFKLQHGVADCTGNLDHRWKIKEIHYQVYHLQTEIHQHA